MHDDTQVIVGYWLALLGLGLYIWKGNWEENRATDAEAASGLEDAQAPLLEKANNTQS